MNKDMSTLSTDPIQPFWVLGSASYYKKISSLPAIAHFYRFQGGSAISDSWAVPDGAIDIIIECGADRINARICGPVSRVSISGFEEGRTYFGIRLHPELLDHLGDASISDLAGHQYALEDLVHNRSFLEQISQETDFIRQTQIFEHNLTQSSGSMNIDGSAHRLTISIVDQINRHNGIIRVSDLEDELHYSRRHLTRVFSGTMGMDIKTFADYARFQGVLRGIRDGSFKKASDAAMAGNYYDQSHFQKAFRSFTNMTPYSMIRLFQESDYASRITVV